MDTQAEYDYNLMVLGFVLGLLLRAACEERKRKRAKWLKDMIL